TVAVLRACLVVGHRSRILSVDGSGGAGRAALTPPFGYVTLSAYRAVAPRVHLCRRGPGDHFHVRTRPRPGRCRSRPRPGPASPTPPPPALVVRGRRRRAHPPTVR